MRRHGKITQRFLLAAFLVAAVTASCSFAQSAVEARGKFTLPFEAHWGTLDLKPGNYSFSLRKEESGLTLFAVEEGQKPLGWVFTSFTAPIDPAQQSDAALFCARHDGACAIHALVMPSKGVFYFNVPGMPKQLQAQNAPNSQSVPVLLAEN